MSEAPNIVYGRLLESAHITGYGFERMTRELELLLSGDDWRQVGPGFADVNVFLRSIDLSAFNLEDKARLHKRIKELQPKASVRAIGKATGSSKSQTHRDISAVPNGTTAKQTVTPEQGERRPAVPFGTAPATALQRPPSEVAKAADTAARKETAAAETKVKREASRNAQPIPDGMDLRYGDARDRLDDVPQSSVALVLTDPPYGDESEPLYEWLAKWAARVLVPGGSLICYTGQSRLDRDMRIFGEHLRYWWSLAMMHHQSQRLPGKFVIAGFKPVLWYVKDHRRGRSLVPDVLKPPARDKELHNWAQGEGGVSALIEHLTEPGETIADPFAGTATWGRIAASMGRRWVGATLAEDDGTGAIRA